MRKLIGLGLLGAALAAGGTAHATPFTWGDWLAEASNTTNGAIYVEECPPGTAQNAHIFDGVCRSAANFSAPIDGEPQILIVGGGSGNPGGPFNTDSWGISISLPSGSLNQPGSGGITCPYISQSGFIGNDSSYWPSQWVPSDNHFFAKSSASDLGLSTSVCSVQETAVVNGVGAPPVLNVRAHPSLIYWNTDPIDYTAPPNAPQAINLRIDMPLGPQYGNYTRRYFFYFVPTTLHP
jgi:hypothetical protein